MSTVFPVWGATFLVCLGCWGVGSRLVTSKVPLVAMLCGWCVFLILCSGAWVAGLSANALRPFFWLFYAAGIASIIRDRRWVDAGLVLAMTGAVTFALCRGLYRDAEIYAFGAHGTDMWGYVGVAEWLYQHSTRELPDIGNTPMRFNWTWYVLHTRERPLIYELIACLGASTGINAAKAYIALPIALMATLAMAVARAAGTFGFKYRILAAVPAVVMVFHPLIILPWIAGFAAGSIVGLAVALAFAALVAAEDEGPARTEAVALAMLMMVFCGGLYSPQFMLVGVAIAGALAAVGGILAWRRDGWRACLKWRPNVLTAAALLAGAWLMLATRLLSGDEFIRSSGFVWREPQVWGQFLGIFGYSSPYSWLFYRPLLPSDLNPRMNPVGLGAAVVMVALFAVAAWHLWRARRDLRVPLVVAVCVAALLRVGGDERAVMAKAMPIFGFTLVILIAAISTKLRPRWLGLAAVVLCSMPAVRSFDELREMISTPYITCTDDNMRKLEDGEIWRTMACLFYLEDKEGFDWSAKPKTFFALTCYLPEPVQAKLAQKYHVVRQR
jgi:hypothetical protein